MRLATTGLFTARRYASAVFAVIVCPSVCPSVTSRYFIETTGRIELVFGMVASFYLSHYQEIWISPTVRLLYGVSHGNIRQVQSVQNAAARLLTGARRREHISPVLRQLHWLPIQSRVNFKLACFVFSSLSGHAPSYLSDDIHLVSEGPRSHLRSSTDRSCVVPCTYNTFSDKSFAVAGPRVWNSLPGHLRDEDITYSSFRREHKTYWFSSNRGAM